MTGRSTSDEAPEMKTARKPRRRALPLDVKKLVLHEAGYRCGNPSCRSILTLDIHHLIPVSSNGGNSPDNLLALCPNCHALHHRGEIPLDSIRAWKLLALAINEAYDRKTLDLIAALGKLDKEVYVSGDGLLSCSAVVASGLVEVAVWGLPQFQVQTGFQVPYYRLSLTSKGKALLAAWQAGDQAAAVASSAGA
ncbi:MAG: HNH endonuclease signature motif containing protein [bacterium]|nr:HNH endonuclease signature motif containing protein [bacterium]